MTEKQKVNNIVALFQCKAKKCAAETKRFSKKQREYAKQMAKLAKSIKMDLKVREARIQKITVAYLQSIQNKKLLDCQLQKCYAETEKLVKGSIKSSQTSHNETDKIIAEHFNKVLKNGKLTSADMIEVQIMKTTNTQLQKGLEQVKPLFSKIQEGMKCYDKHCKDYKNKVDTEKKNYLIEVQKLIANKKIQQDVRDAKMQELTTKLFDTEAQNKYIDCQLGKCRKETEGMLIESMKILQSVQSAKNTSKLQEAIKILDDMLKKNNLNKEGIKKSGLLMMQAQKY